MLQNVLPKINNIKHYLSFFKSVKTLSSRFLFIIIVIFSTQAHAYLSPRMNSIFFEGSLSFRSISTDNLWKVSAQKMDIGVIYSHRYGASIGLRYLNINDDFSYSSNVASLIGPTIGYYAERGFFFTADFIIQAYRGSFKDGQGLQYNIGYLEHYQNRFHIGVKYSFQAIEYNKDETNLSAQKILSKDEFPSLVIMYSY